MRTESPFQPNWVTRTGTQHKDLQVSNSEPLGKRIKERILEKAIVLRAGGEVPGNL